MKNLSLAFAALFASLPAAAQHRRPGPVALDELVAMDAASAAPPAVVEKKKSDEKPGPPQSKGEAKSKSRVCPRDCVWVKPLMGEEYKARQRAFRAGQVTSDKP